jgi:hypothetical protein
VVVKYRRVFEHASLSPTHERGNNALAVPLTSFAAANNKFFNAPDLDGVLARQHRDGV